MARRNQVLGLDHVVLRVKSLERSIDFFRAVLGARVERELQLPRIVQMRIGDSLLDLVPGRRRKADADHNLDHFAVRVADLDRAALSRRLAPWGIQPGEPAERYGAQGYGLSIYFTDPDGNMIEFKGPATRPPIARRRRTAPVVKSSAGRYATQNKVAGIEPERRKRMTKGEPK